MANTATVTGNTGPGGTVTALVLNDVTDIDFDFGGSVISIAHGSTGKLFKLAWTSIATVTFSINAGVAAVTIST